MPNAIRDNFLKNKKRIWLIIIIIIILLVLALLYWLLGLLKQPQDPVVNINTILNQNGALLNQSQPEVFNNGDQAVVAEVQAMNGDHSEPEEDEQASVLFIATAFAERFGSYSNQGNFSNFDDLVVFMTPSMSNWVATYKADLQKQYSDFNTYYAIDTKAISSKITDLNDQAKTGEILVKTQRQEYKNDITNANVFYQDILLKIVKIEDEWKVNAAYWQ